jgi:hypothetical protein
MQLHLEKAHGLKLEAGSPVSTHETRPGLILWRLGEGREAKLVLEELTLSAPGLPVPAGRNAVSEKAAPWAEKGAIEPDGGDITKKTPPETPAATPAAARMAREDLAKQLAAAYRSQYVSRGDPHGPPPVPME